MDPAEEDVVLGGELASWVTTVHASQSPHGTTPLLLVAGTRGGAIALWRPVA
jgi:hypothetical protein